MKMRRYGDGGFQSVVCGLQSAVYRRKAAGFTLIELLVVVAIIGILATILMPAIGRVQERGREVRCNSNLRQLHTAAVSYMHANDFFPHAFSSLRYRQGQSSAEATHLRGWVASVDSNGEADFSGHAWWYEREGFLGTASITNGTLFPYLEDLSVYVCPTMSRLARQTQTGDKRVVVRSYGMNAARLRMPIRRRGMERHVMVHFVADRGFVDETDGEGMWHMAIEGPSRTMLFADQGFNEMDGVGAAGGRQYLADDNETGIDNAASPPGPADPFWGGAWYYYRRMNSRVDGAIDVPSRPADNDHEAGLNRRKWIGEYHGRRAGEHGEDGGRANVVFVDGHVESVSYLHTDYVARGAWENRRPIE